MQREVDQVAGSDGYPSEWKGWCFKVLITGVLEKIIGHCEQKQVVADLLKQLEHGFQLDWN